MLPHSSSSMFAVSSCSSVSSVSRVFFHHANAAAAAAIVAITVLIRAFIVTSLSRLTLRGEALFFVPKNGLSQWPTSTYPTAKIRWPPGVGRYNATVATPRWPRSCDSGQHYLDTMATLSPT